MATKRASIKPRHASEVRSPSTLPGGILFRREPLTPVERLAVCYMNRPHDSIIGVPYETWEQLAVWGWCHPDNEAHVLPDGGRGMGLKAPDAIPLNVSGTLASLATPDDCVSITGNRRTVWLYPVIR